MEDRNYYMTQEIDNSGVSEVERFNKIGEYLRDKNPTFLMKKRRLRPNSGSYFGASSSKWDSRLPSVDYLIDEGLNADQARGIEQTTFNRIGNALVNNAVIAGTTAISGSIGVLYGAIDALANQELSKLYDNPVNRKMLEWQESAAHAAPNYYTKEYEESSIWNKLGTSIFWADLIKNLGYTEGMLIPSMGASAVLSKAPMAMQLIGSSLSGALSEASIEALQDKQDKLSLESSQLANEYNEAIRNARSPEERQLIEQEYKKTLNSIEDDSNKVGNYILGYNMALLTATNALEWGKLFTRGNKASRVALLAKERSKGIKVSEDDLSLDIEKPWLNTAKNLGTRGYQAIAEGTEEVLQDIAVRSADLNPDYNTFNDSVFNPDKRELVDDSLQALGMAFSQAMKDPETATNFAMGFFTSVLGSPRFRGPKEDGKWRSPVTMEGGVTEFIREKKEYGKKQALVSEINQRMSDPSFTEYYNGLVRDIALTEKANQALEAGDEFNFQNYQFASIVSDIIMLDNVGHSEILNTIIDKASNISDEEVQSLIDSGLFQQNGNPMSIEDARLKIQENAGQMKYLSSQYRDIKEALEASKNGSQLSKDALENLIYAKMQLDNWKNRQKSITDEIVELYKTQLYDDTDAQAISPNTIGLVAVLPETRQAFKKAIEESDFTDDVKEEWLNKINDLDRIQDSINKFSQKINEYYSSPQKANKEQEKIKEKAISKDQKKKSKSAKEALGKASTPKALRSVYNNILSEGKLSEVEITRALNELEEEGNPVAIENKKIQSFYQGAVSKLSDMGLSNQEVSNAISMLHKAMDDARNLNEMLEPSNPAYTNLSTFFDAENPSSGDQLLDAQVFLEAQAAISKAIQEQLKEMGKNAEAAKFTIQENPAPGTSIEDTTGDSGVTPAPPAKFTDSLPVSTIESDEGELGINSGYLFDNLDQSGISEQPNTEDSQKEEISNESSQNPNKSWFPLSWFFLGSKRKGKLIPISDTQSIQKEDSSVNFGQIPQWLEQNRVQEYIDSGKLRIGDKLVLGIPNDLKDINGNPVVVYYKVEDGKDSKIYTPVGIFAASGDLAKKAKAKILEEYKSFDVNKVSNKTFLSSITTTVNDIKTGYIEYGESRDLEPSDNVTFVIIRNGAVNLGTSSVKPAEIKRPKNITEKNGMVYIAIPNSRKGMGNGYSLAGVKIKKFNAKEFDLTSPKNSGSPVMQSIRKGIDLILHSQNQEELKNGVQVLSTYLYMPNLNFYLTSNGNIRVTRNLLDKKGNVKQKLVKKADGTSSYKNAETVIGTYKSSENLLHDLYKLNLNFNISKALINNSGYKDEILKSGIASVNAINLNNTVGGWFTANPVGEHGEIKGNKIPFNNPVPTSTPTSIDNSVVVTINGRQITLFPTGEYLSLKDGKRKSPLKPDDIERYKALYNLQKLYGNATEGSTMWNNKAIIGGKVVDRTTGEWVVGAAAEEVKNHVHPKQQTSVNPIEIDKLFENHDDMNPVEDLSEASKIPNSKIGYYFDSRDKRIHKTYMVGVGNILGTPVQVIKIPELTSGLSKNGPKKVAGYFYGIVLPNGQSYISANMYADTPINTVFNGIRMSFEGPGSGPKGQEFIEKHKREFSELRSIPSVFPDKIADPIEAKVKSIEESSVVSDDDMSFEDFAAMMGADIKPTAKLREVGKEERIFDIDSELKWLNKVLPNIPVEVQKGLIHIAGTSAWGAFNQAGITLSDIAAKGTAYHEAFHAVFSLGLSGTERVDLVREASKESGLTDPIEIEEWLAERFREYVIDQQSKSIGQKIRDIFKKLWNLVRGVQKADSMRYSIYKKIMSGGYKNIKQESPTELVVRLRERNVDNSIFREYGYSDNWIENSTEDEKRIARYCIGM